jgi:hypothetical protein
VQEVFERYGLTYTTGPLPKQVASAWAKIIWLSLPNGFVDAALGPLASALPKSSAERSAALIA